MSYYFRAWQDSRYVKARYDIISIDQDKVRMSEFVQKKLESDTKYMDGKAFYTSSLDEEDLLYCKKILHAPNKLVSCLSSYS